MLWLYMATAYSDMLYKLWLHEKPLSDTKFYMAEC